jgi:hypothetical protein
VLIREFYSLPLFIAAQIDAVRLIRDLSWRRMRLRIPRRCDDEQRLTADKDLELENSRLRSDLTRCVEQC